MREGIRWWGKPLCSNAVGAKIIAVLANLFSTLKFYMPTKAVVNFTHKGAFHEEAFQHLLQAESKRSQRSGHGHHILLVYRTDVQGAVVQMDQYVASAVLDALTRSLRETDYVGWYREGLIAGGVLTVVGQESAGDVQERLKKILEDNLGETSGYFRIRLCRQHELPNIERESIHCLVVQQGDGSAVHSAVDGG